MPQRHRPPPTAAEGHTAADTLTSLYAARYPDDTGPMPDDLLGLVAFIHRHTTSRRLAATDRGRAHIRDALPHVITILDYLAGEVLRMRLAAIEDARAAGMTLSEIAGPLGQSGRQAVGEEIVRLQAHRRGRPRNARTWRAERDQHAGTSPPPTKAAPSPPAGWPVRLVEAAWALLATPLPGAVADEAELLTQRLPGGDYASPSSARAALALLLGELRGLTLSPDTAQAAAAARTTLQKS